MTRRALARRLGAVARRAGRGTLGPPVFAVVSDWPPEARAAYAAACDAGDLRAEEDLLERHAGVRPRLARTDGRPLPVEERSLVVLFDVRPDGPR